MIEFLMIQGAPRPMAPFSHATAVGGWQLSRGKCPPTPDDDGALLPAGIEAQTRRAMENLKLVLASAGCSLERVVFARVYLTNFDRDYDPMNGVYQSYFAPGRPPARTCIGVTGLAWVHSSRPICWRTRKAERAPPQAAPPECGRARIFPNSSAETTRRDAMPGSVVGLADGVVFSYQRRLRPSLNNASLPE
jgi:2-iminobutanoate/2-iminopropanoate deaminase